MAEEFSDDHIIFSNLPSSGELCHAVVSIDPKESKDSSVKSDYQWQLLKTRILIFSDVNVLASPVSYDLRFINVVCKKIYFTCGSLTNLLDKNRLKVERVMKLTNEIYEACLMYHFISKLAPGWNRVEKLFVEGRYFLMKRGQLGAIELNYELSDDRLILHVLSRRLWLRQVELLDFDLPLSVLEHSVTEKFYKDLSHEPQWVHVLPSFKRGRIVYLANYIPEKCTFTDYKQMRRHWKNTYGFRLPEEGSSMTYVGVNFFGPLDYTYPLVCVRRGMHLNIGDPNLIYNFVSAICTKASNLCGSTLKLVNPGIPIQPQFMIKPEPKWEEKNLLEIDKYILENFLMSSNENILNNNTQLSLCSESQTISGTGLDSKGSTDDWFIKCSNFIEGLSQIDPKKSRSKALRKPLFMNRSRQFIKLPHEKSKFLAKNIEPTDTNEEKSNIYTNVINSPYFAEKKHEQETTDPQVSVSFSLRDRMESTAPKTPILYKPVFTKPKNIQKCPALKLEGTQENAFINNTEDPKNTISSCATVNTAQKPVFLKHKPQVIKTQTKVLPKKTHSEDKVEKKPEVKRSPTIFADAEIEKLHQEGKLSKVNSASLILFLKKNGITCKKSDKKPILLSKAALLLSQYISKT